MPTNRTSWRFRLLALPLIALIAVAFLDLSPCGAQARIVKSKIIGGKELDFANSVDRLADGKFVVGGWTSRSAISASSAWVLWLDSELNLIREVVIDGLRGREMKVTGIAALGDGGVIASGWETYGASRLSRGFVLRLNANGAVVWKRTVGGGGYARAIDLARLPNGDVVVSGWREKGKDSLHAWLFRMTDSAELKWNETYEKYSAANSVHLSETGEIVVGSHFSKNKKVCCDNYPSIFGLNDSGKLVWEKSFEHLGRGTIDGVKRLPGGGYLAVGSLRRKGTFEGDGLMVRLDAVHNLLWSKRIGPANRDFAIREFEPTQDEGFFLIANQDSSIGWLLRVDRTGSSQWAERIDLAYPAALFETLRLAPRSVFVVGAGTHKKNQRTDGVLFFVQD